MKRALAYPCLALLLFSCNIRKPEPGNEMPRLYPPPVTVQLNLGEGYTTNQFTGDSIYPIINAIGDTVPTGVPVPARGRIVYADHLDPPVIVPAGKMKVIPAHPNVHQIPEELTVIPVPPDHPVLNTSIINTTARVLVNHYGDTVHTGVPLKLEGKVVPCQQPEPLAALPPGIKEHACNEIRYLDVTHGLNSAHIHVMMKDSRGNIWMGTNGAGACRYDGRTFTHYSMREGLSGTRVRTILEDSKGNIWFGTGDGGVSKYDGATFTQYSEKEGFLGRDVRQITEDSQGNLWFAVSGGIYSGGVSRYDGETFTYFSERENFPIPFSFSVLEDQRGNIWIGSYEGVTMYDGGDLYHYWHDFVPTRVITIFEDSKNLLWFGSNDNNLLRYGKFYGGLCYFDGNQFTHLTDREGLSHNDVRSILEDDEGMLWCGTESGVNRYDGETFTHYTVSEGLSNDDVLHLMDDGEGNFWMATNGGGVNIFRQKGFQYLTAQSGLTGNHISSVLEDRQGNLWFGSYTDGVSIYDGECFRHLTMNEGLSSNNIMTMCEDHRGNIWMGTLDHGLTVYDGTFCKQFLDSKGLGKVDFNDIIEDSKGNIWLGYVRGLTSYDGHKYVHYTVREGFSCNGVQTILEDRYGNLWVGTMGGGISKFDGQSFTHYTEREGLSGNYVTDIAEDNQGNLWIATWGAGVNRFDGESFTCFTRREGLNGDYISTVLEDSLGNIWVSTMKGLNQLVFSGVEDHPVIYTYNIQDILSPEFNTGEWVFIGDVLSDSRNRIWWGNAGGLTMLDMNEFSLPSKPPQNPQLSHLEINEHFLDYRNLPDSLAAEVKFDSVPPFCNYPVNPKISHRFNHLTFHLSATDWTAPHKIMYSYCMEGLDRQWSEPSSGSRVNYRNIPHGSYTFSFRAIGAALKWSDPFEYTFTIRPPWWFSGWAYALYGMILIAIVLLYRRYLLRRAKLQSAVEIERIEKEKVLEIDRMKSRFFANISHEFRTPLTLILGPVENMLRRKDKEDASHKEELGIIHRNARRLQQLINQLLDISKLETGKIRLEVSEGNLSEFIKRIVLSFLSLAESRSINYTYDLPETPPQVYFDRDKVEKIITNLLSNAFKFTPAGGKIHIRMKYDPEATEMSGGSEIQGDSAVPGYAVISVSDTGKGIPGDQLERIFDRFYQVSSSDSRLYEGTGIGLSLTRELVDICRGEIRVESEPGKGSVFTVTLPVSGENFHEDEIVEPADEMQKVDEIEPEVITEAITGEIEPGKDHPADTRSEKPVILVVEDNADLRKYISSNLEDQYRLKEAENGLTGLEAAIETIPDLIITDLMMPEMDGIELCSRIRKDQRINHIPVVMLTAKADKESKLEGLETGADDYLVKPFDVDELRVRVKNLIQQRVHLREKYRKEFVEHDLTEKGLPQLEDEFIRKISESIQAHLDQTDFGVEQLGREIGFSRSQLYRKIHAMTGFVPSEFIRTIRLKQAASMFAEGHTSVKEVLYTVGFSSPSYFSRSFRELFGTSPTEYISHRG